MFSSGIKRGLAVSAVSALAVAGAPFLAGSAQATPLTDQVTGLTLLSQGGSKYANTVSFDNDGTNTTVSLVAAAPADITSVSFQYRATTGADTAWKDINSTVSRNADGAFTTEWAKSADVVSGQTYEIRATANTGATDTDTVTVTTGKPTIELNTEGPLGIYANPLNGTGNVAVRGTTSDPGALNDISVFDTLQDAAGNANYGHVNGLHAVKGSDGVWAFSGVLSYPTNNYPYSAGTAANQVALTAAIDDTEDTEASTYYVQSVSSVSATPAKTNVNPANPTTSATVTVLDAQGKPVAGATVGYVSDDNDSATPAAPVDHPQQGTTNADGKVTLSNLGQGTYTAYADTNGTAGRQAGDISAQPFTITSYNQEVSGVSIAVDPDRSAFDFDELDDTDFTVTVEDQNDNGVAGQPVQYRWTVDPTGAGTNASTAWTDAAATNADGEVEVPFTTSPAAYGLTGDLPGGTYTLEARRPNVGGTGLTEATPVALQVNESEVTFADGAGANAPVNGDYTVTGNLALIDGGPGLGGRTVTLTEAGAGDASFAPQSAQPAGTTVSGGTATATTDASGNFSVVLRDPAGAPNVPPTAEDTTVRAVATALVGNIGRDDSLAANDAADSEASVVVHFQQAAEVDSIAVDVNELLGDAAPGRPVDLDVTVFGKDGNSNPADNPELTDYPVEVTVDKGFLSPGAATADDLVLDPAHAAPGDLFGYYQDLGTDEDLSTGDDGEASIVAAIERDADFDDDGQSTMTVTVTAGGVTKTQTVVFDARHLLNMGDTELVRAAGQPTGDVTVGSQVKFNLFTYDQFGNLAGDQPATVTDDSSVADVDTDGDFGATLSDFSTSGADIVATSDAVTTQTLTAALDNVSEVLVGADGNPDEGDRDVSVSSDPINWVAEAPVDEKKHVDAKLSGKNNGGAKDKLTVKSGKAAAGATVKLFKIVKGKQVLVAQGKLSGKSAKTFKVADKNGAAKTKYVAKLIGNKKVFGDKSNVKKIK